MHPAHVRFCIVMTALLLASCEASDLPASCRDEEGVHGLASAKADLKRAEVAIVRARMMGPSPNVGIPRPPDFEPDPVAVQAVAALKQARKNLADVMERCRAP